MRKVIENPLRDWFNTIAGSILAAGIIGLIIPSKTILFTYFLAGVGSLALVFGLVGLFQPKKEVAHAFISCSLILLLLISGQHYGVI